MNFRLLFLTTSIHSPMPLPLTTLARLCRRVGTSLHAGLDVRSVWEREAARMNRPQIAALSRRVSAGETVADSMEGTGGLFPPLVCEMVRVGEQTGRPEEVFHRLADHYEHLVRLRRTFLMGVAWPLIELTLAVVIVAILIWALGMIGQGPYGEPVDVLGIGLTGGCGAVTFLLIVAAVVGVVVLVISALTRGWLGSGPLRVAMYLPLIGPLLRTLALSRLSWSLGMAIDAGMDAQQSVRLALRSTQNVCFAEYAPVAEREIEAGREMNETLRGQGIYPAEFLEALETGELTGQVPEMMSRLSDDYRRRAEAMFRLLAMIGGILVFLCVGVVLVIMIIRLFWVLYIGPIYDALEQVN